MTTSESKDRFFLLNESIRITNRIDWNRELECSSASSEVRRDPPNLTPAYKGTVTMQITIEFFTL